jgi:uncharacterized protein YdeI (YjbR/CyaY-like superfamily)
MPFASQHDWERWLEEHHQSSPGLWLQIAKKAAGIPTVTYAEALEVALCFGWIDGQKASLDEQYWTQRFLPRGRRSIWSKVNRAKAEQLIASGAMQPSGLREVERARADGRWDAAYDPPSTATVPDDLARAFDANPAAREFFETLDSRNRYSVLHRIQNARRPETRARRIEQFVDMLARGETIHPTR